jgi:hypothetical protein
VFDNETLGVDWALGGDVATIVAPADSSVWLIGDQSITKYDGSYWTHFLNNYWTGEWMHFYTAQLDLQGNIWAWYAGSAIEFSGEPSAFTTFSWNESDATFPGTAVYTMAFGADGSTWVGGSQRTVYGGTLRDRLRLVKYADSTSGEGVVYTTDNSGLPENNITVLAVGPDLKVWIGTAHQGLAILDGTQQGIIQPASSVNERRMRIAGSAVTSIAPNPMRGNTTVHLQFRQPAKARLALYDSRGTEVLRVLDGEVVSGERTVTVNVESLPAGAYFLRLVANGEVSVEPVVVRR